jgi:uncharacterized protein (TIRG00374 family)
MKSTLQRALRLVAVSLLVAYVLHRAQLTTANGWTELLATLEGSNVAFLVASLLFTPLVHVQSTAKWYALTRARGMRVTFRRLYYFFVVGRFYNVILPSNIGGDLVRMRMLGVATGRQADAAATVFVERLTGIITLIIYASIAAAITAADRRLPWLMWVVALVSAALAAMCWAIVDERPVRLFTRLLRGRTALVDKVLAKMVRLRGAIVIYRDMPLALAIAFANSVLFYLICVGDIWLTVRVFDPVVPFAPMLIAVPIMMFVMNIPLSVGNVGVIEFAYTVVLGAFGVSPQAALAAVLLMRIKTVLAAAVGGVAHALTRDGSASADAVRAAIPQKAP